MADITKIAHGTPAWFQMVGAVMIEAVLQARLAPDVNISLVERYTDGIELGPGLVQGLRFELADGKPSFRIGVASDERGDITLEVTTTASHALNTVYSKDPRFHTTLAALQASGTFRLDGDLDRLGAWFDEVHDRIVARTG